MVANAPLFGVGHLVLRIKIAGSDGEYHFAEVVSAEQEAESLGGGFQRELCSDHGLEFTGVIHGFICSSARLMRS